MIIQLWSRDFMFYHLSVIRNKTLTVVFVLCFLVISLVMVSFWLWRNMTCALMQTSWFWEQRRQPLLRWNIFQKTCQPLWKSRLIVKGKIETRESLLYRVQSKQLSWIACLGLDHEVLISLLLILCFSPSGSTNREIVSLTSQRSPPWH